MLKGNPHGCFRDKDSLSAFGRFGAGRPKSESGMIIDFMDGEVTDDRFSERSQAERGRFRWPVYPASGLFVLLPLLTASQCRP